MSKPCPVKYDKAAIVNLVKYKTNLWRHISCLRGDPNNCVNPVSVAYDPNCSQINPFSALVDMGFLITPTLVLYLFSCHLGSINWKQTRKKYFPRSNDKPLLWIFSDQQLAMTKLFWHTSGRHKEKNIPKLMPFTIFSVHPSIEQTCTLVTTIRCFS